MTRRSRARTRCLVVGPPLALSDLGSANGTRVRERKLESGETIEIAPGDVIELGYATLIVQQRARRRSARSACGRTTTSRSGSRRSARAPSATAGPFAVVRLHVSSARRDRRAAGGRSRRVAPERRGRRVRPGRVRGPAPRHARPRRPRRPSSGSARVCAARRIVAQTGAGLLPARRPQRRRAGPSRLRRPAPRGADRGRRGQRGRSSPTGAMQDLYRLVERIAAGNISVLILGETGVGKEVLAERVHRLSPRAAKPFLQLNCAALSETLLESELFGHESGAFTGAIGDQAGPARDRRRRHRLPRRDRRAAAVDPGQAPARARGAQVLRVGGLKPRADRRALRRRDQPRPRGRDRARHASARTSSSG